MTPVVDRGDSLDYGSMTAETVRIVLEVEVAERPITGCAQAPDGLSRDFAGWLGLLSVLDAILSEPAAKDRPETR